LSVNLQAPAGNGRRPTLKALFQHRIAEQDPPGCAIGLGGPIVAAPSQVTIRQRSWASMSDHPAPYRATRSTGSTRIIAPQRRQWLRRFPQ
jgi:hypothetical protein